MPRHGCHHVNRRRRDDALLGEELGRLGASDRVWVFDPIDGTGYFSRGDPNWRIHLALQVRGTTEVALVTAPALRRCWWATRGGGSCSNAHLHDQLLASLGYPARP